ncbi:MAG: glycine cleavage system protein GcvH [Propionibacteriaceae bacterium]|jgi:glycine cleavage system H protein|nr:glycine cleavage system protein GcvH [Propionibacteriaceae bacterium]
MADYPEDLGYTKDHEWVKTGNDTVVRVGVTAYAVEAMGEISYISLPEVGAEIAAGDSVAEIETTKAVEDVFAPVSGVICHVNKELDGSPQLVNEDPYGAGWIFEIQLAETSQLDNLLDSGAYTSQLD